MVDIALELDLATNLFGKLDGEIKQRLQAVVNKPSQRTWDNAYSIIIDHASTTTLWQAVLRVYPTCCRSKPCESSWSSIPTREMLIKAIKFATH